ncbi:hypothetical protein PybrP1_005967 [[Pythium] brassicae (nom. inval.)]|nr:hypothetical protein PybrP1_005967 [[Pythium] brassicae (nom. inval.)]
MLKLKLANAPMLCHPERSRPFVVILHANSWAISAVLAQEHGGVLCPARFTGRALHDAEVNYHPAKQEILALLRVLTRFYAMAVGQTLKVYTRHSVLEWLFR